MTIFQVTHWVNSNEYLITHEIKSNTLIKINDTTVQLDGGVQINFNESLQKIVDIENEVIIFEDDDY